MNGFGTKLNVLVFFISYKHRDIIFCCIMIVELLINANASRQCCVLNMLSKHACAILHGIWMDRMLLYRGILSIY